MSFKSKLTCLINLAISITFFIGINCGLLFSCSHYWNLLVPLLTRNFLSFSDHSLQCCCGFCTFFRPLLLNFPVVAVGECWNPGWIHLIGISGAPLHSHTFLKVAYQVLMGIISAPIDFKLFAFQIRVSNAVVVPVYHSSFGPSPLTCQL